MRDWDKLTDVDRLIRRTWLAGPETAPDHKTVMATIEIIGGFELFNTEPYHNYENWGQGYRVTANGITVEVEYLDDAIAAWKKQAQKRKEIEL